MTDINTPPVEPVGLIDTTISGPTSNSYITFDEAETILTEQRLWTSAWTSASDMDKVNALLYAALLLDVYFDWVGTIAVYPTQRMGWPRFGAVDKEGRLWDHTVIPPLIKRAQAELALFLLVRDRTSEPAMWFTGLSDIKVGPIELRTDHRGNSPLPSVNLIPDTVIALVSQFGTLAAGTETGSVKIVKLERG